MKCPKCKNELSVCLSGSISVYSKDKTYNRTINLTNEEKENNFCKKCYCVYKEDQLQKIKDMEDIDMMNEDINIWKSVQKYK